MFKANKTKYFRLLLSYKKVKSERAEGDMRETWARKMNFRSSRQVRIGRTDGRTQIVTPRAPKRAKNEAVFVCVKICTSQAVVKRAKNDDNTIAEWADFLSSFMFNTWNISICPVLTHIAVAVGQMWKISDAFIFLGEIIRVALLRGKYLIRDSGAIRWVLSNPQLQRREMKQPTMSLFHFF